MFRFLFFVALTFFAVSCASKPADNAAASTTATQSSTTATTAPAPAPKAQPYKVAIGINICDIKSVEVGEDIGFYMIETEDALAKIGIKSEFLPVGSDLKKVDLKAADGSVVKTIDLSTMVNAKNCVGFLVARDGAEHKFIPLEAGKTEADALAYFK